MEDVLIEFKTAKLAKEKGFHVIPDRNYYNTKGIKQTCEIYSSAWHDLNNKRTKDIIAPTQSLLQKWLREVHKIVVESIVFDKGFLEKDKFCYQYRVYNNSNDWITGLEFNTYEQALEEGLQIALNLIK